MCTKTALQRILKGIINIEKNEKQSQIQETRKNKTQGELMNLQDLGKWQAWSIQQNPKLNKAKNNQHETQCGKNQ
jgi:hypothetical protein